MSKKKDKIDWLFNQQDARKAIVALGARNLTQIIAVTIDGDKEEKVSSYSDMVMYGSQQADQKAIEWMKKQVTRYDTAYKEMEKEDPLISRSKSYLYFRFQRFN